MYKWQEAFLSQKFSSNLEISKKVFNKTRPKTNLGPRDWQDTTNIYPIFNAWTMMTYADWFFYKTGQDKDRDKKNLELKKNLQEGDSILVQTHDLLSYVRYFF